MVPFQTHMVPFLIYTVLFLTYTAQFLTYTVPFRYQNVMVPSPGTILWYTALCLDTMLRWYRTMPTTWSVLK